MTVEPLRVTFRRQLRESALATAHEATVEKGWGQVRMSEIALSIGVSRPTLYAEFGDKQGLGEALVLRETERFLTGIAHLLNESERDASEAITRAVRFALDEAEASPLLRAVLTSARGVDHELLPMLTTRSAPVLEAASGTLVSWFTERFPQFESVDVAEAVDALVRLTVSHIVMPADEERAQTASRLAAFALRYIGVQSHVRPTANRSAPGGSA